MQKQRFSNVLLWNSFAGICNVRAESLWWNYYTASWIYIPGLHYRYHPFPMDGCIGPTWIDPPTKTLLVFACDRYNMASVHPSLWWVSVWLLNKTTSIGFIKSQGSDFGFAILNLCPTLFFQLLILCAIQPVQNITATMLARIPALLRQITFSLLESDTCGNPVYYNLISHGQIIAIKGMLTSQ